MTDLSGQRQTVDQPHSFIPALNSCWQISVDNVRWINISLPCSCSQQLLTDLSGQRQMSSIPNLNSWWQTAVDSVRVDEPRSSISTLNSWWQIAVDVRECTNLSLPALLSTAESRTKSKVWDSLVLQKLAFSKIHFVQRVKVSNINMRYEAFVLKLSPCLCICLSLSLCLCICLSVCPSLSLSLSLSLGTNEPTC